MSYSDSPTQPSSSTSSGILTESEQREIKQPNEGWSDSYALKIVRTDFAFAESYRTRSHDWRYRNADEMYLAWVGQRYWEGTRVPSSSLGVPVIFEQVESMLPKIVDALADANNYEFKTMRSDQKDMALAWRRMITGQLNEVDFREQLRRACKSMMIYGNGVIEFGFEDYEETDVMFTAEMRAKGYAIMPHPVAGQVPVPQGVSKSFRRKVETEKKQRPYVRYVSVKDLYIDPNCESPNIQEAGYVIKRIYMSAEKIKSFRGNPAFKVPTDEQIAQFSKAKTAANQDVTKASAEYFRYVQWNPSQDWSSDPAQKRIEVIEYTTPEQKVWTLNREWVFYNKPNRYKCINFVAAPYADVLDRWYGLSVSDIAEGEQRLQTSILNARIDELALALHPGLIKRRGVTIPAYQLKTRPGRVVEVEQPEGDLKQFEIMNITQQAYVETEASERRVQRMTGLSDLAALGTPTSGGNSANRTAAGVNTQVGATQDRVRYILSNMESALVEPILNAFISMDKKFFDPKVAELWLANDPEFKNLDPIEVFNCQVTAQCRASAKMASRAGFMQVFPLLAQTYLNPELLQLIAQQQQKTVNAEELADMLMSAISYAPRNPLFIQMTQQQLQAMRQPPPAEALKAQIAQGQTQSSERGKNVQAISKILTTIIGKGMDTHAKLAALDDQHLQSLMELLTQLSQPQQEPGGGEGEGE